MQESAAGVSIPSPTIRPFRPAQACIVIFLGCRGREALQLVTALKSGRLFGEYWDELDAWFEEDEQVFVHPRDPYTRVDTVHSSRHVRVGIEGVTLGETRRPILLFETGLPARYYIPKLDVRMDLLEPTESVTRCPYKGVARYWSARLGDKLVKDIVWSYPAPIPECPKIENLLSFYNEHVDMNVDGVLQDRPITPFS
jgi:uncharacterized protein (DUF427 family)